MTELWYDWPSVPAIVLILVVCLTKLHNNKQLKFHTIQKDTPDGIIFHEKKKIGTLLQNLPHIKIAVKYHNLSFRVNLYKMYIITCN